MKRPIHPLLLTLALTLGTLSPAAFGQGKEDGKLTSEIRPGVQATIVREKANGRVSGFRQVNDEDGTTYRVSIVLDGRTYHLALDAVGRVMSKDWENPEPEEKEVTAEALPEHVKKTFMREAMGARVGEVRVRDEKKSYWAEIVVNGRKYMIVVDAAGKLVRKSFAGEADGQ